MATRSYSGSPQPRPRGRGTKSSDGTQRLKDFPLFERRITEFNLKLRKLSNKARKLRSSAGIIAASTRLRDRLNKILDLFRTNRDELFSKRAMAGRTEASKYSPTNNKKSFSNRAGQETTLKEAAEHISEELQMFLQDIATLLECFNQFPEFADEVPDHSLGSELKDLARVLDDLTDEFGTQAVQRFLFDSMTEIGEKLEHVAEELIPVFIKVGIPTVRCAQEQRLSIMENLSMIATLFSGVTATMLQFSWNASPSTTLYGAANAFWFTSLVFSISAAVNSLLGLSWTQAVFRSPDHRVPWWVRIWITQSPLAFLVLSVACFFVGLIAFVYASNQTAVTSVLTAVLSTISCFGLAAMSFWVACEFWVYRKHRGRMWLADTLYPGGDSFRSHRLVNKVINTSSKIWDKIRRLCRSMMQTTSDDVEMRKGPERAASYIRGEQNLTLELLESSANASVPLDAPGNTAKARWQAAIRHVLDTRQGSISPVLSDRPLSPVVRLRSIVPVALLNHKLRQMTTDKPILKYDVSEGLVKFLNFSSDGHTLATSSWNGRSFTLPVIPDHLSQNHTSAASGSSQVFIKQVEWSPEGDRVLIRTAHSIRVFRRDGTQVYKHTPEQYSIRCAAWLNGTEIIAFEKHKIGIREYKPVKLSATGSEESVLPLALRGSLTQRLKIRGVVISKDSSWMLCISRSQIDHEDGETAEFKRCRNELLLVKLHDYTIMIRYPMFDMMSNISLTLDNTYALISYENRVSPQLLRLYNVLGPNGQIRLERTYMPVGSTNYAALPSRLGGTNDNMVLRATADGNIHFWHTYSGSMLYRLAAPPNFGHITAFAWNRRSNEWMLATGNHLGMVYVWTIDVDADTGSQPDNDVRATGPRRPRLRRQPRYRRRPHSHLMEPLEGDDEDEYDDEEEDTDFE